GRPVIIANGFFPVPIPLGHIAAVYQAHGFDARIVPFALRNKIDVHTYAQTIEQMARDAYAETGLQVDIIGLSMGGIAALYAIKFLAAAPHIRTLIAIGSPFHGSPVAAMSTISPWFSRTARQLAPDSELLKELRAAPRPPEVRFISLGGIFDTISPLPTTRLDEAENYFWFFGHHDLMFLGWLHWEVVKLLL
ncbi:GPI inositol-deacylase, partial [Patescibacteria group bacterium]|nr:GPI inositol-deacylase [Patescibacteria group bacterium]